MLPFHVHLDHICVFRDNFILPARVIQLLCVVFLSAVLVLFWQAGMGVNQ
jgi:hypothetical protein